MSGLEAMRDKAKRCFETGRLIEAIECQVVAVNTAAASRCVKVEDYTFLGALFYAAKDFPNAAAAYKLAHQHAPDSGLILLDIGLSLLRANQLAQAWSYMTKAAAHVPDDTNLLSGLAEVYGRTGDLENARVFGGRALATKDRLACESSQPAGALRCRANLAGENVISFSLFGTQARYWQGAIRNANRCAQVYPGWTCRFYCDDQVPDRVRAELVRAGAVLVTKGRARRPTDGLFWRFLVSDDPVVARFLVRDCDSLINVREQRAVNEWIASGKQFHIMRDYCTHTDLILAGMWGGIAGVLPPIQTLLSGFSYDPHTESRVADQRFLGRMVWPLIKGNCLIHDSLYRNFNAKRFPANAELPPGRHVGDNDAILSPICGTMREDEKRDDENILKFNAASRSGPA